MKFYNVVSSLFLTLCVGCGATDEVQESVEEPSPEWNVLFDGSSMDAWRGFRAEAVPAGWGIVDGCLERIGSGSDLITREEFASFLLEFDWRVTTVQRRRSRRGCPRSPPSRCS